MAQQDMLRSPKIIKWCNKTIKYFDKAPLWLLGFVLFAVTFSLYLYMGEQSVFDIHDQLDESAMNYVLPARHMFEFDTEVFPEMLGGIRASAVKPADYLSLPLYSFFPTLTAFLIQYAYVFLAGFFGMYFCVRELTKSSLLSVSMAGLFCMLPLLSNYGLSMYGIPLVFYGFLCLFYEKNIAPAFLVIGLFGISSHLVWSGYAVLGLAFLTIISMFFMHKKSKWFLIGFMELLCIYIFTNKDLFMEQLVKNGTYVSHRAENVKYTLDFWSAVKSCFWEGGQHAVSLHGYLVIPIIILIVLGFAKRKNKKLAVLHNMALVGFGGLLFIALFYGFCNSPIVAEFRNNQSGFLRYFQAERIYWLYPAGWYIEFAVAFSVFWSDDEREHEMIKLWKPIILSVVLLVFLNPTISLVIDNSYFYKHVNQKNNGSGITGYITWEAYYAEDLMEQIEQTIGRDMSTYRVAHLGISPCPSLQHGFYTVDGYSNNYSLEYKHKFREVIAEEIEQVEATRLYFDEWGNRCYLFNSWTGTYYMMPKNSGITYNGLKFNMKALKDLGCEYLFSGAEILDADRMGLTCLGYYETESSYWGIWLYELNDDYRS